MGREMGNAFQPVQMQYYTHPQRQFPCVQLYVLCVIVVQEVHHAKYTYGEWCHCVIATGVTSSNDLSWSTHVDNITNLWMVVMQ